MPGLEIVDGGVLFRNPLPGHQSVHGYIPFTVELSSGEYLSVFRRGSAFYSVDGVLAKVRSTDGGSTWADDGVVLEPGLAGQTHAYSAPWVTKLSDGSLVLVAFRRDSSDPAKLAVNQATGSFIPTETVLLRSSDGGHSWSRPEVMQVPAGMILDVSGPLTELDDGRWFVPFDTGKAYDDPSPVRTHMIGLYSTDRGATWSDAEVIASGAAQGISFFHGRVVKLLDGRLFTLAWARDERTDGFLPLHRVVSDVHGRNWSAPESTGIPGQTSWAVDMGDGRMVAAYTYRDGVPPGIRAVLSEDAGRTWDVEHEVQLWDATGREVIGVAAVDSYPQSHDVIAFGRPVAFRTGSGEVLVSFWGTDLCLTQCRWVRLRVQ